MEVHSYVFLDDAHEQTGKPIWCIIALCGAIMVLEIVVQTRLAAGGRVIRDTANILIDMNPDPHLTERLPHDVETGGDRLTGRPVRRIGPGHLTAVLFIASGRDRRSEDYHRRLRHFSALSRVTMEDLSR